MNVYTVIMPDLGQTTAEGKITRWLKRPGEKVVRGEPLFEVETDKVTMEVEATADGYVRELMVREGQTAAAGSPIATVGDKPAAMPAEARHTRQGVAAAELAETSVPTPMAAQARPERAGSAAPLHSESPAREAAPQAPESSAELTKETKLAMYRRMLLCRLFEERIYYLFLEGRLPGTIHQSQGQEACAVGVCYALRDGDMLTSTHRPHAHAVARGLDVKRMMAELFAKATGCCSGKGGSMHIGDPARGMLPAIAIVGGGIPLAAGYALSFQYLKRSNIVACFFGDGAVNSGIFHESVNLAAVWNLPVVFVCENNGYAASTSIDKVMKLTRISARAAVYGIPGETVDGNDVEAVWHAAVRANARARAGFGPTLLELETYRFCGHSRSDPGHYRAADEIGKWRHRDPLTRFEAVLIGDGLLTASGIADIRAATEHELDAAVAFAEQSPSPAPEECLNDVYA